MSGARTAAAQARVRSAVIATAAACLLVLGLGSAGPTSLPAGVESAEAARPPLAFGPVRVATKRAPLSVAINSGRDAELTLRVNGRRVREPFHYAGARLHIAELSAADGLRPGRNRLRVKATAHGGVTSATRKVRIPRWVLFADAGQDRAATVGSMSRVGTTGGIGAGRSGAGLRHRWRVAEAPEGADYFLSKRARKRPLFRPDAAGTYVLQLTSRARGGKVSYDRVVVASSPDDPPVGAELNTLDSSGKIVIAGQSFGGAGSGQLSYVVVERATRAVQKSGTLGTDAAGIAALQAVADDYSGDGNRLQYLMIVSGPSGIPTDQRAAFAGVAKSLGAAVMPPESFKALADGRAFSLFGIPGAAAGAATVRVASGAGVPGAITGYLQKNHATDLYGAELYDLFSTEHPAYDTRTGAATERSNVMRVGSATYDASLPGYAKAAFHVVFLDSLTLQPLASDLFITNLNDASQDRVWQAAIGPKLKEELDRPGGPTVLVQTIGKPKAAGSEWNPIVDQLARLGANRQLLNALDGTSEYSLVGRVGGDGPPAEASTAYDHGAYKAPTYPPARLVGVLSRSRASTFEPTSTNIPTAANPDGGVNLSLLEVAYQPLREWPALAPGAPAGEAAKAEHAICLYLGFCKPVNSCPDMRSCYWQKPSTNWTALRLDMKKMEHKADDPFSSATLDAVRNQLDTEFGYVGEVYDYFARLQEPIVQSEGRSLVDLQGIGQTVYDSVQRPAGTSAGPALNMLSAIAGIFALMEGPIGQMGAGLSASFTFASAFSDDNGQPILGDDIKARASALGEELFKRTDLAREQMTGLTNLLVSDYGKLAAAHEHLKEDWSLPGRNDNVRTVNNLRTASKQWFYEALVPVAYPYLIQANAPNARSLDCHIPTVTRTQAWPNQPDDAQMGGIARYGDDGQPVRAVYFFSRGIGGGSSPPSGLGDAIFAPRTAGGGGPTGVGVEKLGFFTPGIFNGRIVHAVNGTTFCDVGWLPNLF